MQSFFNVLALLSFGVSAVVVAGGYSVFVKRAEIREKVKTAVVEEVQELLPNLIKESIGEVEVPDIGVEAPSMPKPLGL